jgi:hypothetical protein
MQNLLEFLFCYFGALLIPMVYLVVTRFHGLLTRRMIIAILIQLSGTLVVCLLVGLFTLAKSQDAWMGWGWLLPLNLMSLIYSLSIIIRYAFRSSAKR